MYAGDLVLMSETIEGLRNKFIKWNEALYSKDLLINIEKNKIVVSNGQYFKGWLV